MCSKLLRTLGAVALLAATQVVAQVQFTRDEINSIDPNADSVSPTNNGARTTTADNAMRASTLTTSHCTTYRQRREVHDLTPEEVEEFINGVVTLSEIKDDEGVSIWENFARQHNVGSGRHHGGMSSFLPVCPRGYSDLLWAFHFPPITIKNFRKLYRMIAQNLTFPF